jgi:hypothetical protein
MVLNRELGETGEHSGTKRGQAYTEKIKNFSAVKDESIYIEYTAQHNKFETQSMSEKEIWKMLMLAVKASEKN